MSILCGEHQTDVDAVALLSGQSQHSTWATLDCVRLAFAGWDLGEKNTSACDVVGALDGGCHRVRISTRSFVSSAARWTALPSGAEQVKANLDKLWVTRSWPAQRRNTIGFDGSNESPRTTTTETGKLS
jgi:hypothetical protein